MAKNNNLSDFLTDVADSIRRKKGTTEKINPQDFSDEIDNLSGGIEGVSVADGKLKISDTNMPIEISGSDEEIEIKYSTQQQKIKIGTYSDVYLSDETLYNVITAPNLEPENIAKDVNILGVVGTFEGGTNTSDATATASDILVGKTAYGKDGKMEGTIETYDGENEEGEIVSEGRPIELTTSAEMDAVLVSENIGKIYKYVGETNDTFTNGNLYQVMEVE